MNIITIIIFTATNYCHFTKKNTNIFSGSNISSDLLLLSVLSLSFRMLIEQNRQFEEV